MPFPNIEDIVENIVDEVFLDKLTENGYYDYDSFPKNFVKLALVSRTFLSSVRRNLYADLRVEGPERFLLLAGQLRFTPHLARLVKRASLISGCSERTHIDGFEAGTPGDGKPRTVSIKALTWFLDACPQLTQLELFGGDFLYALSSPKMVKSAARLTDIGLHGCSRCDSPGLAPGGCTAGMRRGWLKHIVTFPRLKELDITEYGLDGPRDPTFGLPAASSACTGLSVSAINSPASPKSLMTLLKSMPSVKELVLEVRPMQKGALKKCLDIVAPTLTLLTLTDYNSFDEAHPQPWENDTVSGLHYLKTLAFNGVPVTAPFFNIMPPRLEHLRFAGATLRYLPVPAIAAWLRRDPFPTLLKKLDIVGDMRADGIKGGPKASDAQAAELAQLCRGLGIEWNYEPEPDFEDDADGLSDAIQFAF
ncbi:hypothetical protein B0H10DRAFT_1119885 [Mycena sp. CBHHK59/15]|nr:hypothetical protein B0H10DRAFT_1119885 [Mycena sp. CBHHK59/15]